MTDSYTVVTKLLNRPEVKGQTIQRRCFVSSSSANQAAVQSACKHLIRAGWFVYDFTKNDVLESLYAAGVRTFAMAKANPAFQETAESDLLMLRSLGATDVLLLILPAGLSAGWEAGFAFSRSAQIIVCTEGTEVTDVPLYHADHIFPTLREALDYLTS
jgi:hypothetical protein